VGQETFKAERMGTLVTYRALGGDPVPRGMVEEFLAQLPLDGVLGMLASLSLDLVQRGPDFMTAEHQAPYLNRAIAHDFPTPLPGAAVMLAPGHVPCAPGMHLLVCEQNIAWLSHVALLRCKRDTSTLQIDHSLSSAVCRLLLIGNDLLEMVGPRPAPDDSLASRRVLALDVLRLCQFGVSARGWNWYVDELARRKAIYERLPAPVGESFREATGGVGLEDFCLVLCASICHAAAAMTPNAFWYSKGEVFRNVAAGREKLEQVLASWSCTPDEYVRNVRCAERGRREGFHSVSLRSRPLIEARPGQLVCPVMPFLMAKVMDGAYFVLSDHLKGRRRTDFQRDLGGAFEDYAVGLVRVLAERDNAGPWQMPPTREREGSEIADAWLVRGTTCVVLEFKAGRQGTEFLTGGDGGRVLGPKAEILSRLDRGESVDVAHVSPKKVDDGCLTRPMWQQSKMAPLVAAAVQKVTGQAPERVFPLVIALEDLHVTRELRHLYLDPLAEQARLYSDRLWRPVQWLHIHELEVLASLAADGLLDLEGLLERKAREDPSGDFEAFLARQFPAQQLVPAHLHRVGIGLIAGALERFFPPAQGSATSQTEP